MILQPINRHKDLFKIKDLIDAELIDCIDINELLNLPFAEETWQEQYNRRRLKENQLLLDIASSIRNKLQKLVDITEMQITSCATGFWLDGPGFTMTRHLDNSDVFAAMQIYLTDGVNVPGTKFTDLDEKERYVFPYCKNTGYLMINNINQYHEVAGTVPMDTYRLCSYTWFLPKL